jgi:hypothetical protein
MAAAHDSRPSRCWPSRSKLLEGHAGQSTLMRHASHRQSPGMMRHASTVSTTRNRTLPLCIWS